jgi:hypothetical protein
VQAVEALLTERQQVLAAYESQWPLFADSLDQLSQRLAAYGRQLLDGTAVGERLWFDDGVYGPSDASRRSL